LLIKKGAWQYRNLCNHTVWPAIAGKIPESFNISGVSPYQPGDNYSDGFEIHGNDPTDYNHAIPAGWEGTICEFLFFSHSQMQHVMTLSLGVRQDCDFSKGDAFSCATGSCKRQLSPPEPLQTLRISK
jgi:hypothetical protein